MNTKKPKRYKAKVTNRDYYVKGYYFEMPETTYCFASDPIPDTLHFIITHEMSDWSLPNKAVMYPIDIDTLEEIDE